MYNLIARVHTAYMDPPYISNLRMVNIRIESNINGHSADLFFCSYHISDIVLSNKQEPALLMLTVNKTGRKA